MPNLSEVVSKLFQRAGVKVDNPEMIALISNPEISKIPVSDTLVASVESGLHNTESAESVLRPKLWAEITHGRDASLYLVGKEHGLSDDDISELKKIEKAQLRFNAFTTKIKELESKKAGETGKDKKDLVEQIDALKLEQGKLAKAHQAAIEAEKANALKEINDMAINSHIGSYAYSTEDGTPKELKAMFVKSELDKKLAELQAIPKYDKQTGKIILTKQDGTGVFDPSNNPIDFYGIADSIVAEKKLIQISKGSQGGNAGGQGSQGSGAPAQPNGLADFEAAVASAKADLGG